MSGYLKRPMSAGAIRHAYQGRRPIGPDIQSPPARPAAGSPGFDLDTVGQVGECCEVENTAFLRSPDLEQDLDASVIVSNPLCIDGTDENGGGETELRTLGSTGGGGGGIADPGLNTPNNGDGGRVLGGGASASNGSSPGNGAGAENPPTVAGATEPPRAGATNSVLLIL